VEKESITILSNVFFKILEKHGPLIGGVLILFIFLLGVILYLLRSIIENKDKEIIRLVEDNRMYRQLFVTKLFNFSEKDYKKLIPKNDGKTTREGKKKWWNRFS